MMKGDRVAKWLAKCRSYNIEYGGFLSNHLTHNIVVMSAMGAPEKRLQWWLDLYTPKLENIHSISSQEENALITKENWKRYTQRTLENYPDFLLFFKNQLAQNQSLTISETLPHLIPGLAGSLLHPIIHLGLGIQAKDQHMTAEGLAYMATRYQPLGSDSLPREKIWSDSDPDALNPIDATAKFIAIAKNQELVKAMVKAIELPKYQALDIGNAQRSVVAFDDEDLPFKSALNSIVLRLPSLDEDLDDAIIELTALASASYLGTDCEFVILHGVTSLNSVLTLLEFLTPEQKRDLIAHWWRAVMAALVAMHLPQVDNILRIATEWRLDEMKTNNKLDETSWQSICEASFPSKDEHVQKGVYCMWQWSQREEMPERSKRLFKLTAMNQVRPHPSGQLANHLWFGNNYSPSP